MMTSPHPEVPKWVLVVLNQVYDAEQKLRRHGDPGNVGRNLQRIKDSLEDLGVFFEDPMGQDFKETRTDLEVTISGQDTTHLVVVEVMKPVIRAGTRELSRVIQKGIAVVETKKASHE